MNTSPDNNHIYPLNHDAFVFLYGFSFEDSCEFTMQGDSDSTRRVCSGRERTGQHESKYT